MGPRLLFSAAARARVRRGSAPDCPRGAVHSVFANGAAKMKCIGRACQWVGLCQKTFSVFANGGG